MSAVAPATKGDRTRAAVVAAARERFSTEGFDGTTTAEVAADAGVSEATVFAHFGTKSGLLVAVMDAYYDELEEAVRAEVDRPGPAEERLQRLVTYWLRRIDQDWLLVGVFGQQARFQTEGELHEAFYGNNRRITRIFSGLIEALKEQGALREDVPTTLLRDAIFGTVEHTVIRRLNTGKPRSIPATGKALLDLLLRGSAVKAHANVEAAETPSPTLADLDQKLDRVLAAVECAAGPE